MKILLGLYLVMFAVQVESMCRVRKTVNTCDCISDEKGVCYLQAPSRCRLDTFEEFVAELEIYGKMCPETHFDLGKTKYGQLTLREDYCGNLPFCR